MATRTWRGTTSAVYTLAANWLESAIPTSSDSVVFDGSSNHPMTLTAGSAANTIDFTNFTNTFTINAGQTLTVSGNITLSTGMTYATTSGSLVINASGTLKSNGKVVNSNFTFGGTSQTYTIGGGNNWIVSGTLVFSGTTGITINTTTSEQVEARGSFTPTTTTIGTVTLLFSGTGTINSATGVIGINIVINTSGTITFNNTQIYFGNITFTTTAGTINAGTGTVYLKVSGVTLNAPLCTFYNLQINPSSIGNFTVNNNNTLAVSNIFSITNSFATYTVTFAGTNGFSTNTLQGLNSLSNLVLTYGNTYTITNAFTYLYQTTAGNTPTVKSSSTGNKVVLTLNQGATCQLGYVNFTDVDASNGRTITTFDGTLSNTLNILSFTDITTISSAYAY